MMSWLVAGEKIIITPWWPVAQRAGRDESRPDGMMSWSMAGEKNHQHALVARCTASRA